MIRHRIPVVVCCILCAAAASAGELSPEALFTRCAPSVVMVTAVETVPHGLANRTRDLLNPFPVWEIPGDVLRFAFYPLMVVVRGPRKAGGSGVIISDDGLLLTNHHVIEDSDVFWITLHDRRVIAAELIGSDPAEDYALLKLKLEAGETVAPAALGDASRLQPGSRVYAIGSPLRLRQSFSRGIVAAMYRRVHGPFQDYIQTDLTIGSGSSGGPLFNARGELVGLTSLMYAVMERTGGVTFSVPINSIQEGLPRLKADRRVVRGYLGVLLRDCTPRMIREHKLRRTVGACVDEVALQSPARKAGLQPGDVIVKYGDLMIKDARTLARAALNTRPGTVVPVMLFRGRTLALCQVEIGKL
jgi:serine protease Do